MPDVRHFGPASDPRLFKCGCGRPECDAPKPSALLLDTLEEVRSHLGRPMVIDSGPRCAFWNEHEGGEPNSEHLYGDAADVAVSDSTYRYSLLDAALLAHVHRIGVGASFLHLGVSARPEHAQEVLWTYYHVEGA